MSNDKTAKDDAETIRKEMLLGLREWLPPEGESLAEGFERCHKLKVDEIEGLLEDLRRFVYDEKRGRTRWDDVDRARENARRLVELLEPNW